MLDDILDKAIRWIDTMSYEEYLIVVMLAIALGFVFLKGMGSRHISDSDDCRRSGDRGQSSSNFLANRLAHRGQPLDPGAIQRAAGEPLFQVDGRGGNRQPKRSFELGSPAARRRQTPPPWHRRSPAD